MAMGAAFRAANLSTAFRVRKVCVCVCVVNTVMCCPVWRWYQLDCSNVMIFIASTVLEVISKKNKTKSKIAVITTIMQQNHNQVGVTDVSSFGVSVSIESFPQGEPARNWLGTYVPSDCHITVIFLLETASLDKLYIFDNVSTFYITHTHTHTHTLTHTHTHTRTHTHTHTHTHRQEEGSTSRGRERTYPVQVRFPLPLQVPRPIQAKDR